MERTTVPKPSPLELLRLDRATGILKAQHYRVAVEDGPDAGRAAPIAGPLVVGAHESAGLRLSDPAVSRYHVELTPRPEGLRVRDLNSKNGTFCRGMRITDAVLPVVRDLQLTVGDTRLRMTFEEESLETQDGPGVFGGVLGESAAMRRLFGLLQRVAPTDASVLLWGETGTGKERLARAIHEASARVGRPFVIVDCAALAPSLAESELFGHSKGAFTGAVVARQGAFREAHGGTLFLDEVGELPLELQPRLRRVLEAGTVKPVGSNDFERVDVRIVAATHRDLEAEVKADRFRADLFFRIAVVQVQVPPLRARLEDVPLLVRHFVRELNGVELALSPEFIGQLSTYAWPGNVRELRNTVARALAGGELKLGSEGHPELPAGVPAGLPFKDAKSRMLEAFTQEYLGALIQQCRGNLSEVARVAKINRNYVLRLVERYGLKVTRP